MPQRLRIFISSPADVPNERLRADLIVDKLSQDYGRFFTIESYRWEHEPMLASGHFQDAIEPPSAFDIVALILWSRLGTPLPERTAAREYHGIDGRTPVTGTEWEYEEALQGAREKKAPDLLAFRNISPAPIDPRDPVAQAEGVAQLGALNEFWTRHFADRGVFLAAYDEYRTLEEFAERLEQSLRKLIERRIKDASAGKPSTEPIWLADPFRGLESYEFEHAPIFFGRDAATAKATEQLATNARAGRAFLLVSGASGSGKSSLVKAGIVPRLMKPQRISGIEFVRRAVFRPGSEGSDVFLGLAQLLTRKSDNANVGLSELIAGGQDAAQLATHLRGNEPGYLFAHALGRLTEVGRQSGLLLGFEDAKLILVVDQLEELFSTSNIPSQDRYRFIQLLDGLARSGVVWVIATLRADFWHRATDVPELIALAEGHGRIDLGAPSAAELAEMIRMPARAAGLSFEAHPQSGLCLDAVLAEDAATEPGALPLLSFTLDELYRNAKAGGKTILTHASYEALGGLEGAIAKRADEVMAGLPATAQAALPRVLRALATVAGTADQVPVARWASLESFPNGTPARALIDAFVGARLLVAAAVADALPSVRVAHEALLSRWERARTQISADLEFLAWRSGLEAARRVWEAAPDRFRNEALLTGIALTQAKGWRARRAVDIPLVDQRFIELSGKMTTRRRMRSSILIGALALPTLATVGFLALLAFVELSQQWHGFVSSRWYMAQVRPYVLTTEAEQGLKPKDTFRECASAPAGEDYCPVMVVVPAGSFTMGSPSTENGHYPDEGPLHHVMIAQQFAVSEFEVTVAEWNACVVYGNGFFGCSEDRETDIGFRRLPVNYVSHKDANDYVDWLSKMTGKHYRLLSEAEYEYAARAGTKTAYYWGDEIGKNNADCNACGSRWDGKGRAPVGSFAPNQFGLYDMNGGIREWVNDCYHPTYDNAPSDGSAWNTGCNLNYAVMRTGSYVDPPTYLRAAHRDYEYSTYATGVFGFRVARTLSAGVDATTVAPGLR